MRHTIGSCRKLSRAIGLPPCVRVPARTRMCRVPPSCGRHRGRRTAVARGPCSSCSQVHNAVWSRRVLRMSRRRGPTSVMLYNGCGGWRWRWCTKTGKFRPMQHCTIGSSKAATRRGSRPRVDEDESLRVETVARPHTVLYITTECKEGVLDGTRISMGSSNGNTTCGLHIGCEHTT